MFTSIEIVKCPVGQLKSAPDSMAKTIFFSHPSLLAVSQGSLTKHIAFQSLHIHRSNAFMHFRNVDKCIPRLEFAKCLGRVSRLDGIIFGGFSFHLFLSLFFRLSSFPAFDSACLGFLSVHPSIYACLIEARIFSLATTDSISEIDLPFSSMHR